MSNHDTALRPMRFTDIIGLTDAKRRIKMSIDAAKERNEALPHVLLSGGKGLGKTSLALCIANEIGTSLVIANAATIKSPRDLFQVLRNIVTVHGFFHFISQLLFRSLAKKGKILHHGCQR